MQVNRSEKAKYNDIIEVVISPDDYKSEYEKNLKNYAKSASIKGFRKGNVPMGVVKKMYGEAILAEEVNKLAEKGLSNYIIDNKVKILGRPMLAENQEKLDIKPDESKEYTISFEIAYEPDFETTVKSKKFDKYVLDIKKDAVAKEIENIKNHFAQLEDSDGPMEEEDTIYFNFDNSKSIKGESYAIGQDFTEAGLKQFKNKKKGDKIEGKAFELFDNSKLDVKKYIFAEKAGEEYATEEWDENFTFEITNVKKKNVPESLTEEQIVTISGDKDKNTMAELELVVEDRIKAQYENISVNYLRNDVHDYLLETINMELPEDFLQRWIASEDENKMSTEEVKKNFDAIEKSIKWDLFTNKYASENDIKVDAEEVKNEIRTQYMQYFMNSGFTPPQEELEKYVNKALQDQGTARKNYEAIQDGKVLDHIIANHIKTSDKKYSEEDFAKESKERTAKRENASS